ncbi:hypothetical protein HYT26_02240 [Candidatus Pacearchaeota archaeon]|nr:hypothetical protein [Candidatus Pacearchaeota archaeon]
MEQIKEAKDILSPFGSLDVLYYYSIVAEKLKDFLKGKEIAVKIWLSNPKGIPFFLKRGSNSPPLYIEDFSVVDEKMLKLRAGHSLSEVKNQLAAKQELVWEYFVPRKLMDFFYACNKEGQGRRIERVFIDIDKGKNVKSEIAQKVAESLIEIIKNDKELNKILKYRMFIMWTGNSFHIYLILKKPVNLDFYNKYFAYHKDSPLGSFTGRWAEKIKKKTGINVQGGHEKTPEHITIDPSGTPSGKLARCPFSLHMKSASEADGIAVPLSENDLKRKNLVAELRKLTLKKVLENLKYYAKRL